MKAICTRSLCCLVAAAAIAVALTLPTTAMADLITLKVPGITGDLTVAGQLGTIEVLSLTGSVATKSVRVRALFEKADHQSLAI